MVRNLVKEVFEGTVRVVEYIKYSNGKKVKRVLNNKTLMPERSIQLN